MLPSVGVFAWVHVCWCVQMNECVLVCVNEGLCVCVSLHDCVRLSEREKERIQ